MTTEPQQENEAVSAWEEPVVGAHFDDEDALIVDVAGYEGPLDLLLALARTQKVTCRKSRCWHWPTSTSVSSAKPRSYGSSWRPTISSWRRG